MKSIWHSYLIFSLGNYTHKTATETDLNSILIYVKFGLLDDSNKCIKPDPQILVPVQPAGAIAQPKTAIY